MLNPKEIAKEALSVSKGKVNRGVLKVFLSAILAGFFIGLGYFGYIALSASIPIVGKFYGSVFFAIGLVMIIIAGGDLFTGNCLLTIGWFKKTYSILKVLKNWLVVYFGNLIGALILFCFIYFSNSHEAYKNAILNIADMKLSLNFTEALFRGILCNILVAMGVYMSYSSRSVTGKILAAMLPVALFVASGYEHSIANMFVLPLAKVLGAPHSVYTILIMNLLPVTLGNIIGGGILLPGAYYLLFLHDE
jgi:formate/nitrite transporter